VTSAGKRAPALAAALAAVLSLVFGWSGAGPATGRVPSETVRAAGPPSSQPGTGPAPADTARLALGRTSLPAPAGAGDALAARPFRLVLDNRPSAPAGHTGRGAVDNTFSAVRSRAPPRVAW
jgi:hypothetical protein